MGARLRNILAYVWPPRAIDSSPAPGTVDQTPTLIHTSTLDSNSHQSTPPNPAPTLEPESVNVPAPIPTDIPAATELSDTPDEDVQQGLLSHDIIQYEYVHTRLKDILDHRDLNTDLRLNDARAALTGIQDPELDDLCPHSLLFPQSAYICFPVPVVQKKISVLYNTVSFSDSPDMATTCPSIELLRGVYNSGCHANLIWKANIVRLQKYIFRLISQLNAQQTILNK